MNTQLPWERKHALAIKQLEGFGATERCPITELRPGDIFVSDCCDVLEVCVNDIVIKDDGSVAFESAQHNEQYGWGTLQHVLTGSKLMITRRVRGGR